MGVNREPPLADNQVAPRALFNSRGVQLVTMAHQAAAPAIYCNREYLEAGG
jgi:hypothetical protein